MTKPKSTWKLRRAGLMTEKFTITNIQGDDIVTVDIECNPNDDLAVKLGKAVVQAVKQRANLQRANLQRANLRYANLQRADLQDADLRDADLYGANLYGANLYGANLQRAYLQDANLYGANLYGANLYGANLQGAYLYGADLRDANLQDANLRYAYLLCMGDMRFIKTLHLDTWAIGYTHDTLQIGCQSHAIDKWRKWDTEAGRRWISNMDSRALEWSDKHLDIILKIIDASPAEKPQ